MFGFLKDVFDNTVGKIVNTVGKAAGGILRAFGLDGIVSSLAPKLALIPGFGSMFGGLLNMVPKLIQGQIDLTDALKLGSLFLPPPMGALANMTNLTSLVGAVAGQVGGVDVATAGGENLLRLAQRYAFEFAGYELAA
jgi:hypothetical protein